MRATLRLGELAKSTAGASPRRLGASPLALKFHRSRASGHFLGSVPCACGCKLRRDAAPRLRPHFVRIQPRRWRDGRAHAGKCTVDFEIVMSHPLDCEPTFEFTADLRAVQARDPAYGSRCLLDRVNDKTRCAVFQDLGNGSAPESNDRVKPSPRS
jgi:hypothetical protein